MFLHEASTDETVVLSFERHGICYPLVNKYSELENGPVEIVDFPIESGDFLYKMVLQFVS